MKIFCPFCDAVRSPKSFGVKSEAFERRTVVDAGPRPLAKCQGCGAFERERMLHWCMKERLGVRRAKLLHFAPSRITHNWLSEYGQLELTNTDLTPRRYRYAGNVVKSDITQLPFEDDSYEFVVCSHVLEHIPDDARAFAEVRRVLKPGGYAFFMVPLVVDGKGLLEDPSITSPEGRLANFGQNDHVRIYDAQTFVQRMKASGLVTTVFDPFAEDPLRAIAYGIGEGNVVFVGRC